jgi:putative flavoprotein involved in K+ transport
MTEHTETIIVGGGQAGLSVSYCLGLLGRDHIVLEQAAQAGEAWRNHRWDSFTFVTPNWTIRLPEAAYDGDAPDGYVARDDIVAYFERYVTLYRLPVSHGVRVLAIEQKDEGYVVRTEGDVFAASNVVIATGTFQQPKVPSFSAGVPPEIQQLHSGEYRNPSGLAAGAVPVVGSGQSGSQIAEELYRSGRHV